MGCSTSTLDDDPHPSGPNTEQNGKDENEKSKDQEPIITYENNESQGNKFISNEQL